jgi:hypothetical protein
MKKDKYGNLQFNMKYAPPRKSSLLYTLVPLLALGASDTSIISINIK